MILLKYSYIGYWQLDLYANTILGDSVSDTATVTQSVTNHKTWNIFMLKIKEEACTPTFSCLEPQSDKNSG